MEMAMGIEEQHVFYAHATQARATQEQMSCSASSPTLMPLELAHPQLCHHGHLHCATWMKNRPVLLSAVSGER